MLYITEYPRVYSVSRKCLDILKQPVKWFRPSLSGLGQLFIYRMRIRPNELQAAESIMQKTIIRMKDGSQLLIGLSHPSDTPRAIVLYLHTVCGDYTQLSHISKLFEADNIAYCTFTRAGNDSSLKFHKFNIIGQIDELDVVLRFLNTKYPRVPIHAIGASAGSALLIRYIGKYNADKRIKSAVLVSPGYHFIRSFEKMDFISKSYLVNKMKYTMRNLPYKEKLKKVKSFDDWIDFQSDILGYKSKDEFIAECDPVNYLHHINVPSIFISALDDNVFDGSITNDYKSLPHANPNVTIVTTERGGHVMFEDEGHEWPWFIRVAHSWIHNHL